ncbi:unnamed protein product, partial [Urochloa humidicola]
EKKRNTTQLANSPNEPGRRPPARPAALARTAAAGRAHAQGISLPGAAPASVAAQAGGEAAPGRHA